MRIELRLFSMIGLLGLNVAVLHAQSCSFKHANHSCILTIERNSSVAPPPLQMYPGAVITVRFVGGHDFEAYTLDPAPGQATVLTDVTSAAFTNLNAILGAASSLGVASSSPLPANATPNAFEMSFTEAKGAFANPCIFDSTTKACKGYEKTHPCYIDSTGKACQTYMQAHPCDADPNSGACEDFRKTRTCDTDPNGEACKAFLKTYPCDVDPNSDACKEFHKAHPCDADPKSDACRIYKNDPCHQHPDSAACDQEKIIVAAIHKANGDDQTDDTAANFKKYIDDCSPDHLSQFSNKACILGALQQAGAQILSVAVMPSRQFYGELQVYLTPDAQPLPAPVALQDLLVELCGPAPGTPPPPCALGSTQGTIAKQAQASAYAAAVLAKVSKPPSNVKVPAAAKTPPLDQDILNAIQLVGEEQAALDAIRKDLEGYATRLQDLVASEVTGSGTQNVPVLGSIHDNGRWFQATRTVSTSLNRLNLVTSSQEAGNDGSKKSLVVTITAVYGDSHWEASSGVALAFRPIRTFTVGPVISGNMLSNTYISETKAGPEVVPFVTADYRLGHDFGFPGRQGWRSAIYATGGIGYNTSQQSADYLFGPSISWRSVLISALCDYGHGARLAQGLMVGSMLGQTTTITTLPTTNYWEPTFAVGISIRIPPITGR